jgi:hypothetical protein
VIDVFMRTAPETRLRQHLALAVLDRLAMMRGTNLRVLVPRVDVAYSGQWPLIPIPIFGEDFWRSSRAACEEMSSGDYVLIDDDQLPIGKTWLEDGMAALEAHPEFEMLASWSVVSGEVRECPGNAAAWDATRLSIGTPCFVRKGTFVELPEAPAPEYDLVLSAELKARGGRIGFLRHVRHNHLGYEYSQVVDGHWAA